MLEILKLVVPLLCGLVSGFVLAVFAEPARRWFWRPSLHLKFKNEKTPSFQWVYWPTLDAVPGAGLWVRVSAENGPRVLWKRKLKMAARSCRPYLTQIARKTAEGNYEPLHFDALPLRWAFHGQSAPIDIPVGIPFFFDLFTLTPDATFIELMTEAQPEIWKELLAGKGVYRLSVALSADDIAEAVPLEVYVEWNGKWDSTRIGTSDAPGAMEVLGGGGGDRPTEACRQRGG